MPAGFHQVAVASSDDGDEGASHALRASADRFVDLPERRRGNARHGDKAHPDPGQTKFCHVQSCPLWCIGRCGRALTGYPTSTAAATTVVQRPFLSPTAVWVTFWVRTISFERR